MTDTAGRRVLLADTHHGLSEGIRSLLETAFDSVFMVSDEHSLLEGAQRLRPPLIIIDLALAAGDVHGLVRRVLARSPESKVIVLTVHHEPSVADTALDAGVHGVVLTRSIATDLLVAVWEVLAGQRYISPAIGCTKK